MVFRSEYDFENSLVNLLSSKLGWKDEIIYNPTEKDLIENLRGIINNNNNHIDALNGYPLTNSEMQQIMNKISQCNSPFLANQFLKGGTVSIIRDNENDKEHYGKPVYLFLFDPDTIGGRVKYQIVRQPKFNVADSIYPQRRGDLQLLINGLPLIHIELKNHDIPITKAFYQIQKYAAEGAWTGIWSLVQMMVVMNPEEARYFANPGHYVNYDERRMNYWEDSNNTPILEWDKFAKQFLSIPGLHKIVGLYSIADKTDASLKIFRSYQYWAAEIICQKAANYDWKGEDHRGGYVWHTMASGKTLTSLKVSELLIYKGYADKVCFLTPRNELGSQTYDEYRAAATDEGDITDVESTNNLIGKLKAKERLIITVSIQKMARVLDMVKNDDRKKINQKKIIIMVDECHFSVFGDMMLHIKDVFENALFFGFTGTPITEANKNIVAKTSDVFGDELCRYTAAEAMRDGNILGFSTEGVSTYKDRDLRTEIAKDRCKVATEEEALNDEKKRKPYLEIMNDWSMTKVETYVPTAQYKREEHRRATVEDIKERYSRTTIMKKYHTLFAASSIPEAIEYWRLFRAEMPELKVAAVFDSNDNNNEDSVFKLQSMKEIVEYYNDTFKTNYDLTDSGYRMFKKDAADRIRHKGSYVGIKPEEQIDMIIVVNQMLEGFDSHYINTLFLDKEPEEEHLIQALSRTIRKESKDKTQGNIYYYRRPNLMKQNIEHSLEIYAGTNAAEVFVDSLIKNLTVMNAAFIIINSIFEADHIENYSEIPKTEGGIKEFVRLFNRIARRLISAKIQGFEWNALTYTREDGEATLLFDERTYNILLQRYNDIARVVKKDPRLPYEIKPYLTEGAIEFIDEDYLNERFTRWQHSRATDNSQSIKEAEVELRKTFAQLSKEDRECAEQFLLDIEFGRVVPDESKTFKDYILEYKKARKDAIILNFSETFGISYDDLQDILGTKPQTLREANEAGKFDNLQRQITIANIDKAVKYFSSLEGETIAKREAKLKFNRLLEEFILSGGEIDVKGGDKNA